MTRPIVTLLVLGLIGAAGYLAVHQMQIAAPAPTIAPTPAAAPAQPAATEDRVTPARAAREAKLRQLCAEQSLPYPPSELFIRALKREQMVEVWAGEAEQPLKLLASYPLTAFSGHLGPKRREGDRQIPEGVYAIDRFNPLSSFHLSLGLDYPNKSDHFLSDPEKPGYDIFIHGGAASVGCLAIGNDAIEELFILATDVRSRSNRGDFPVHIFPARMDNPQWYRDNGSDMPPDSNLVRFWENLRPIYLQFEKSGRVPRVSVDELGLYRLGASAN
ncbi:L,D-transpeptidase family protein [Verrucomicrobiota bacterium sgz303538]